MLEFPKVQFIVICCFKSTSITYQLVYHQILGFLQMTLLFFFSVVQDRTTSVNELNNDLLKIRSLAYQWKMSFNPDSSKQAQEVIFSRKIKKPNHPELIFNNIPVNQTSYQKHLGMFLDNKLNFGEHLKYITNKVNKSIGLLHKLQMILPRRSLVIIYKSFIRAHLDYGDIMFDQAFNKSFHDNLESIQEMLCWQ